MVSLSDNGREGKRHRRNRDGLRKDLIIAVALWYFSFVKLIYSSGALPPSGPWRRARVADLWVGQGT